jgi:O-acetyl-ADP-ribose deacetylase (regulator of RNase III)
VTPHLQPSAYAHLVDLHQPFDAASSSDVVSDRSTLLADVAAWLAADYGASTALQPMAESALRRLITRLLTVRPPRPIPPPALAMLDHLFAAEARARPVVGIDHLLTGSRPAQAAGGTVLHLWRGDITTLAVDAIVNAANTELLGCFQPGHACIDNAIHTAAGPRLREDCHRIITLQGHSEPTGTAKATRAYHLPSRYVLHTVGPIVPGAAPSAEHRRLLAGCYEACLDVAAVLRARSVAFCAISTGVFGYPKAEAAEVALETVRVWAERHPAALDLVVFDVFSEADEDAYRRAGGFA